MIASRPIHSYGDPSRAEARQSRRLEDHSACVARCRRLRELCSHETTMQWVIPTLVDYALVY